MWENCFRLGGDRQKSQGEVMSAFGFGAHTPHWPRGLILVVIHPPLFFCIFGVSPPSLLINPFSA